MAEELTYFVNGKALNPEPLNMTLHNMAVALKEGNTVVANLEPGDASFYALLIVPCWGPNLRESLGRWGVPPFASKDYCLVTQLRDHVSKTAWITIDGPIQLHQMTLLNDNEWTQQVFAWWFENLREELEEMR